MLMQQKEGLQILLTPKRFVVGQHPPQALAVQVLFQRYFGWVEQPMLM
jgi:hypothetical protein